MASHTNDRRVLITGLSGFTGRHLAETLTQAGWQVAGLGGQRLPCAIGKGRYSRFMSSIWLTWPMRWAVLRSPVTEPKD